MKVSAGSASSTISAVGVSSHARPSPHPPRVREYLHVDDRPLEVKHLVHGRHPALMNVVAPESTAVTIAADFSAAACAS